MAISMRLTNLRMKKGKSLQEVADAIGASKTHVWELEKGRSENPSLEMLTKLADYYEVPISFLAGENFESSKNEQIVRMFRQVGELTDLDRRILDDMIQSLRKRREQNDSDD